MLECFILQLSSPVLSYLKKWKWTITNSHSLEVICPSLVWPPTHLWVQYMFLVCKPWGWFTGVRWQYSHLSSSSCVYLFTSNFIWVWLWIYHKWTRYEPTGCPYEILQAIGWRMEKKNQGKKKKIGLSVYRKTLSYFYLHPLRCYYSHKGWNEESSWDEMRRTMICPVHFFLNICSE